MRIVSANLNQRIGNDEARSRVETWLTALQPDLFLTQEPFKPDDSRRPLLRSYRLLATTPLISSWIHERHASPDVIEHSPRWHQINIGDISVHNVYLSPQSPAERRDLLREIGARLSCLNGRVPVVFGDFNLAPHPEDGLFGDQSSRFTKSHERHAFHGLLQSADLIDATCRRLTGRVEFTIERIQRNKPSRFRCDLALISRSLTGPAVVKYDHSVRIGRNAFTDHSAIVAEIGSVSHSATDSQKTTFQSNKEVVLHTVQQLNDKISPIDSYKTAIKRTSESFIARALQSQGVLRLLGIQTILDFGCGYGLDVEFYRGNGYAADGFDIEPRFGWPLGTNQEYDLVTLVYVVNVLPSLEDRMASVRAAAEHVRNGGYLLIAARSEYSIAAAASKGKWATWNDGWISDPSKGTFQKGIGVEEIAWLAGTVGFRLVECPMRLNSDISWRLCSR